jgi:hypothetical protein
VVLNVRIGVQRPVSALPLQEAKAIPAVAF